MDCNPMSVHQAAKANKITHAKIDGILYVHKELGPKEWFENFPKRKIIDVQSPDMDMKSIVQSGAKRSKAMAEDMSLAAAERKKKIFDANIAELKFLEANGSLISAELVEKRAFEVARKVRDQILNIPNRIAPELAADTDPHSVEQTLYKELIKALEALSKTDGETK